MPRVNKSEHTCERLVRLIMKYDLLQTDQVSGGAAAELVEHSVPVRLLHLRVDVEAAVAKLRHLLRQKLHPDIIIISAAIESELRSLTFEQSCRR